MTRVVVEKKSDGTVLQFWDRNHNKLADLRAFVQEENKGIRTALSATRSPKEKGQSGGEFDLLVYCINQEVADALLTAIKTDRRFSLEESTPLQR